MRWGQRPLNRVLHGHRCMQGYSIFRIKDRGRGYTSWVAVVRRPLSRRHREVGRGRDAVGSAGGMRFPLSREREGVERLYEVLRTFLICFVLPACHGDEWHLFSGVSIFKRNQVALDDWTTGALGTKGRRKVKVTRCLCATSSLPLREFHCRLEAENTARKAKRPSHCMLLLIVARRGTVLRQRHGNNGD
jgi:hypothetical protein